LRNNAEINSITNRVPMEVRSIDISRSSSGASSASTTLRIYRNATTAGALTWVDFDATNSPAATSITTTTITSATAERSYGLSQTFSARTITFGAHELVIQPGENIAIGILNSGSQSTDFVVTINWIEQF
jgi:hypothetical protein